MEDRRIVAVRPEDLEDAGLGAAPRDGLSPYGFRIGGSAPSGVPVHHDPEGPGAAGKSPAFGVVGDLGCGKSWTAATLMRRLADKGGRAVAVDPRSDLTRGLLGAGSGDGVEVLRLTGEREDPLRFPVCSAFSFGRGDASPFGRGDDAMQEELLFGFLRALGSGPERQPLLGEEAGERVQALRLAVRQFVREDTSRRTCAGLLDGLTRLAGDRSRPERLRLAARREREQVEYWREDYVGRIVLDDEEAVTPEDRCDPDEAPVTIVDVAGLLQPTRRQVAGGSLWESERIFMALLPVVAAWAWRLAAPPLPLARRVPPTCLILEGAWLYTAGAPNPATTLLGRLLREGRARNVGVGLTAEFYADIEPLGGFLSTLFVGRHHPRRPGDTADATERSAWDALGAAGVGASTELRERLGTFSPGEFLLRDWRGRAGFVRVQSVLG